MKSERDSMTSNNTLEPLRDERKGKGFRYGLPIKLIISALFVVVVLNKVDVREMWNSFKAIDVNLFLCSYLFVLLGEIPLNLRLKGLMIPTVLHLGLVRLIRVSLISKFYGLFLPAGLGASISRWYKITGNREGRGQFIVVTVVEKAYFLMSTLLFVGIPILLSNNPRIQVFKKGFLPVFWILMGLLILFYAYIMSSRVHEAFRHVFDCTPKRGVETTGDFWDKLLVTTGIYHNHWKIFFLSIVYTLVMQICLLIQFLLLFMACKVNLQVLTIVWVCSLVFLVQALPISFNGMGVRETGFAYLLGLYGIDPEKGVLIGLLFMANIIISAIVGGILELTEKKSVPGSTR